MPVAVDVPADLDGRVVDEHADGKRQAAERHDVERVPGEVQAAERREDRERDRRRHDDDAAHAPEEEEDHRRHEQRRDDRLLEHAADGGAHEDRLVEVEADLHALGRGRLDERDEIARGVDDGDGRRARLLQDREVRGAVAVDARDVLLDGEAVVDLRDVTQRDGGAAHRAERDLRELRHDVRAAVQEHVVVDGAHARRARGQDEVRAQKLVHDVLRRDAVLGGLRRVEVDHHLALLAAVGRGRREPGNREKADADEVQRVVVDLLLGLGRARDGELRDRHVRRVVPDDARQQDSRRHAVARRLGDGRDLRDGPADVGPRLEVDLEDADARHRLRLDARDAVDRGGVRPLAEEDDAPLHFLGRHAGVVPDDDDDGDVDDGKNVRAHALDAHRPEEEEREAEHGDRVGPAEGEADYPHRGGRLL